MNIHEHQAKELLRQFGIPAESALLLSLLNHGLKLSLGILGGVIYFGFITRTGFRGYIPEIQGKE